MKIKKITLALAAIIAVISLASCRQSSLVSHNVSKEADNFGVCRRITVINSRTDTVIYELEGIFALSNGYNDELEIICKTGEDEYKKHFIYLTDTILYVVEDVSGADVSPYHYEVTFYPQMIGGVDIQMGD